MREHETSIALVTIIGLYLPCARSVKLGKVPEQSSRPPVTTRSPLAGVSQILSLCPPLRAAAVAAQSARVLRR